MKIVRLALAGLAAAAVATCALKDPQKDDHPGDTTAEAVPQSPPQQEPPPKVDRREFNLLANRLAYEYLRLAGGSRGVNSPLFANVPPLLAVDSSTLQERAARNIAALDREMDGKHLLVMGHVLGVRNSPPGKDYLVELPGGVARFDGDAEFVATLEAGYPSEFVCTYRAGLASIGYGLDGCRSLVATAQQVAAMVAMQPERLPPQGFMELVQLRAQALKRAHLAPEVCTRSISVAECADLIEPEAPQPASGAEGAGPGAGD